MLQLLNGKFCGGVTAAAKAKSWEDLAGEVSAVSGIKRSAEEIKKKWSCVKSEAKGSAVEARKGISKTGGNEMVEGVTASQQRVIELIGEVCVQGVTGGMDIAGMKFSAGMCR